jgi:hypothetical protein
MQVFIWDLFWGRESGYFSLIKNLTAFVFWVEA